MQRAEWSTASAWAQNWLLSVVLPLWTDIGVDPANGGAVEKISLSGAPLKDHPRRMRVQARQIYSISQARFLGWTGGQQALDNILDFWIRFYALDNGGWRHVCAGDGSPMDETVDVYDHAFALLALGWAYQVTGEPRLMRYAEKSINLLLSEMRHPSGGFKETLPHAGLRRANPHMHLLEMSLHWMELFGDERMGRVADEIVHLYKESFSVGGLLREYFNDDLTVVSDQYSISKQWIEPGHLIEWAHLLRRYSNLTGKAIPSTATLEAVAETFGVRTTSGLLADHCTIEGVIPAVSQSRLWPQTEFIRLKLENALESERAKGLAMLNRIRSLYLNIDGRESGLWRDVVTLEGEPVDEPAPASTLYHMVGALLPLLEKVRQPDLNYADMTGISQSG